MPLNSLLFDQVFRPVFKYFATKKFSSRFGKLLKVSCIFCAVDIAMKVINKFGLWTFIYNLNHSYPSSTYDAMGFQRREFFSGSVHDVVIVPPPIGSSLMYKV